MLLGIQLQYSEPHARKACRLLERQSGTVSLSDNACAEFRASARLEKAKQGYRVSQFLRGAGLASLFRDFCGAKEAKAASVTSGARVSHLHHSGACGDTAACEDLPAKKSADTAVLACAFVKLPHVSTPTGILSYTDVERSGAAKSAQNTYGVLSAAADGYLLTWEYKLCQTSAPTQRTESSTCVDRHTMAISCTNEPLQEDSNSFQRCGFKKMTDVSISSRSVQQDSAQRESIISWLQSTPLTDRGNGGAGLLRESLKWEGNAGENNAKHAVNGTPQADEPNPSMCTLGHDHE